MWCDNYDPKEKWCYTKSGTILHPFRPKRCPYFKGIPLSQDDINYALKKHEELRRVDLTLYEEFKKKTKRFK